MHTVSVSVRTYSSVKHQLQRIQRVLTLARVCPVDMQTALLLMAALQVLGLHSLLHTCPSRVQVRRRWRLAGSEVKFPSISLQELLVDVRDIPDSNPPRPSTLRNKYYGLRHGESEANIMGIISSDPVKGASKHGLTATGVRQSRKSAMDILEAIGADNIQSVIFLSSYYKRARETAYECIDALCLHFYGILQPYENTDVFVEESKAIELQRCSDSLGYLSKCRVIPRDELRERYFGDLDATVLINYNRVWPVDMLDASNTRYKVESVQEVVARVAGLVASLEAEYADKSIIMCSHADTLQIFQTYMNRSDPRKFSQFRFRNGELRNMEVVTNPVPLTYR